MTDAQQLHIGTMRLGHGITIDLEKLIVTKLLIQANSGGGKSYAIRWLLEQTYGKVQQIVIDREGEFSTLRGIHPYLLVGSQGDVAADTGTAKLLARKVLELGLSAIVDLSEMTPGQQRAYVRVFIDSLNHAPRALWKDCIIVIDEAHIFAPEKGKGESEARESIALLLSTGRKRGFCAVLATQRLAKLDKDVAAECLNKLIGRTSNEDIKRAAEELGQGKQSSIQLRGLDPGTFWAYGTAIAPEPVLVRTGKVKTAPPARGAERSTPPAAPEEIRAALAAELAELPKQAADEANELRDLRTQVVSLSRELGIAKRAQPEPVRVQVPVIDQHAIDEAVLREREKQRARTKELVDGLLRNVGIAAEQLTTAQEKLTHAMADPAPEKPRVPGGIYPPREKPVREWQALTFDTDPAAVRRSIPAQTAPRPVANGADPLPRGAIRILETLAQRHPGTVTRGQLGKLAKFAIKGGTFNNYFNALKRRGLIEESGINVGITASGLDTLGLEAPPMTLKQQWAHWKQTLNAGERKMLETVESRWPNGIDRYTLGEVSGYAHKGGTFGNYLGSLKRNGLVEFVDGNVILADQWARL